MVDQDLIQPLNSGRIDADIAKRVEVHQANVARLASSRASANLLAAPVENRPLILLAQGDSWFDYPLTGNGLPLTDTDVIAQLRRLGDMPPTILNLAHYGETASDEMSLHKQERIIKALTTPANWLDGKPDAILFSAGGNDIAGDQFCIFLDFNDGKAGGLNSVRFSKAMQAVEACYLDLFAVRDRVAPGVPIFGHCYDYPIPNGSHPICAGPWLKPSLDHCNWTVAQGTGIVRKALEEFRVLLDALANDRSNNFFLIDTQGTLQPPEWANELHPTKPGFGKMAQRFYQALKGIFPSRI